MSVQVASDCAPASTYFAVGTNNGVVKLFYIEQNLSAELIGEDHDPKACLKEDYQSSLQVRPVAEHTLSPKPCTGLHWARIATADQSCLIVAQLGAVHVINMSNIPAEAASSSKAITLILQQLRNWAGMTPWAPCIGELSVIAVFELIHFLQVFNTCLNPMHVWSLYLLPPSTLSRVSLRLRTSTTTKTHPKAAL